MAQALFDDHPIELYLRESGEVPELMPGGLNEFSGECCHDNVPYNLEYLQTWLPRLFSTIQPVFESILTVFRRSSGSSEFAERFKYIVISSPLLSSSLSSSSVNRATTPTTPGHYYQSDPFPTTTSPPATVTRSQISALTLAFLVPLALARGYYLLCILLIPPVIVLCHGGLDFPTSVRPACSREETWTSTLNCLEELVAANQTWDNVVGESLGILENEEQFTSQPLSPSSSLLSLRIALSSTLHTTETQSDNVRQLLAALTSPLVLSQLSHMYAPPRPSLSASPKNPRPISLATASWHSNSEVRPLSLYNLPDDVYTRSRSAPSRASLVDKRSTWNGSYMTLAGSSSRQPKRRPNLSTIFRPEDLKSPIKLTFSGTADLSHVYTAPERPANSEDVAGDADAEDEPFGVAALDLHRRRGMRVSMLSTPSPPSPPPNIAGYPSPDTMSRFPASHGPPLTASFGSTFTSLSSVAFTSRHAHALSLSNLHFALQGALGSKRFACAHLLALRFSDFSSNAQERGGSDIGEDIDVEDESYWEDVRSVIALLTSSLEDASARLTEALADTMRKKQEAELITDEESVTDSVSREHIEPSNSSTLPQSFAPMPSHLARFAAHVDTITSALDDAQDHLQQCVASLKEDAGVTSGAPRDSELAPMALQSYERLRRELGLALRECERGRGTLLEFVHRNIPHDHLPEDEDEDESPGRQDEHLSSGESDKTLCNSSEVHEPKDTYVDQGQDHDFSFSDDDATSQLILTTSPQHLPPPGIEQVFESVSAAHTFVRERSKLTREERIRIAKARREGPSGSFGLGPESQTREPHPSRETWGPGGEVVQELKDVIWQVSERRRKMIERSSSLGPHPDGLHSPS